MGTDAAQRVKELERLVAQLTQERDDLTRDLENLCLSGGSTFSTSSVLSERIYSTGARPAWRRHGRWSSVMRLARALSLTA